MSKGELPLFSCLERWLKKQCREGTDKGETVGKETDKRLSEKARGEMRLEPGSGSGNGKGLKILEIVRSRRFRE